MKYARKIIKKRKIKKIIRTLKKKKI